MEAMRPWSARLRQKRKTLRMTMVMLCAVLFSVVHLFAQSDLSGISGTITDPSGAVVRGAMVTVTDEATGIGHRTKTNESGYYTIPSLSPGRYTIQVQAT